MARLKSWQVDQRSKSLSLDIQTAISVLSLENTADRDTEEFRKVDFVNEQLRLLLHKKTWTTIFTTVDDLCLPHYSVEHRGL